MILYHSGNGFKPLTTPENDILGQLVNNSLADGIALNTSNEKGLIFLLEKGIVLIEEGTIYLNPIHYLKLRSMEYQEYTCAISDLALNISDNTNAEVVLQTVVETGIFQRFFEILPNDVKREYQKLVASMATSGVEFLGFNEELNSMTTNFFVNCIKNTDGRYTN
jgi:hypothetical protein